MTRNVRRLIVQVSGSAWLLGLLAGSGAGLAQDVIAPPPSVPATPPAMQQIEAGPMAVIPPGGFAPGVPLPASPFQYGPVTLHPHTFYQFLYGNGVQSAPGERRTTVAQTVAPGLLVDLGTHWTVDYTPRLTFYSSDHFRDTLDHEARLTGGIEQGDWVLGLSQSYTRTEDPMVETAQQITEDRYLTGLNASWRLGQHLSLDFTLNQDLRYIEQLTNTVGQTTNSREWSTLDWLNYQFWPRLDAGLGLGGGYVNVGSGPDSAYEQYQARVRWRPTDKVSFQLHGGLEDRQFLSGGAGDLLNPVFGAEMQYLPFEATTLTLRGARMVNSSLYQDQLIETTEVTGDLTQRLLKKLYLSVGGGYHFIRYVATAQDFSAGRRDEYYSVDTRLRTALLKHGSIAAVYQLTGNSSNRPGFGYTSHQVGFEIEYRY